jgi:hypothetical protein
MKRKKNEKSSYEIVFKFITASDHSILFFGVHTVQGLCITALRISSISAKPKLVSHTGLR